MSTRVQIEGLVKHYGDVEAVAGIDLTLEPGRITALLGPSGCGKTTTLKAIAGLVAPSFGDIRFDGASVTRLPAERRGAVMVFQSHLLFPYLSVGANVAFGLRMRGTDRRVATDRSTEMLGRVGLAGFDDRRPHELSGGQQQRVALARALVVEPRVLLLDEPLANLDTDLRDDMRALIAEVQQEYRLTTLMVTHDRQEAVILADRIALMLDGRIEQVGAPATFFTAPRTERAARFFGWSNLLAAAVADPAAAPGGSAITTPVGPLQVDEPFDPAEHDTLAIRPESIRLVPCVDRAGDVGDVDRLNSVEASVIDRVFLGDAVRITVEVAGQRLQVHTSPEQAQGIVGGQRVTVTLPPDRLQPIGPR